MAALKWLRPAAAILLGVALVALLWEQRPTMHSDDFMQEVDGQPWLIAGLTDAQIMTPDRPFDPDELQAWRDGEEGGLTRWRRFHLRTNSLGFRGPEVGPKAKPRVLALGGSVSMGWGVDEEDSWPALVTRDLGIEVLNVGIPGAEPAALAAWCRAVGPSLDVDALAWVQRLGPEDARHLQSCVQALGVPAVVVLPPRSLFDTTSPSEALGGPHPVLDLTPIFRKGQHQGASLGEEGELLEDGDFVAMRRPKARSGFLYGPEFEDDSGLREPLFFDQTHPDEEGALLFASSVGSWLTQLTTAPSD